MSKQIISADDEIQLNDYVREWLRERTDGNDFAHIVDEYIPEMIDEINIEIDGDDV